MSQENEKCDMCQKVFTLKEDEDENDYNCDAGIFCEECWSKFREQKGEIYEKWLKTFVEEKWGCRRSSWRTYVGGWEWGLQWAKKYSPATFAELSAIVFPWPDQ